MAWAASTASRVHSKADRSIRRFHLRRAPTYGGPFELQALDRCL